MKFVEITASDFRKFAEKSPYQSFLQTPEIATHREKSGWSAHYFAVKEGKPTLAATLLLNKPTFLGKSTFYTPGGPLLDLENTKLTTFFFKRLIDYAKNHGAYVFHIDPYFELIERDRDGKIVPNGFNRQKALKNLQNLGFLPVEHTSQPKYLFALDLAGRTADQLFASFKQNTRNLIHRSERQGITVRELTRADLPVLKQITASTAVRRHFLDQPLSYYQEMYDLFHPRGEIKFLLAEIDSTPPDPEDHSEIVDTSTISPESATSPRKIPLSVAMFMLTGPEIVYLYSGSDQTYMKKYNAQYLIQWHMIKYAAEHGFRRYNFYGIRGLPDPASPDYGIYRFKKGFGGHVVELIGSFELPVNKPIYHLHHLLSRLKNLLH